MSSPDQPKPLPAALSALQIQVLAHLAHGATVTAAAESVGVHRSTIHNWLKAEPKFSSAVEHARNEYVETLRDELKALSALSLTALRAIVESKNTPPAVRLRAVLAVLNRPQFPRQDWALPERIQPLESEQAAQSYTLMQMELKHETALEKAALGLVPTRKSPQSDT